MAIRHFSLYAVLSLCAAFVFATAAPAVAAVHRHVIEPIGRYLASAFAPRDLNGLEYAAVRGAASARTMTASQTRLFAGRRADRVVGAPALAFDMGIPRQGGLLAC